MGLLLKKRSAPTTIIAARGTKRSGVFRFSNPTSSDTSSVNTTYSTSCSSKKVRDEAAAPTATRKRVHFDESLNQVHHHDHNTTTDVTNEELWYSSQEIQRFVGLHLLMVRELVRTQTNLVQLIDQTAAECYKQVKPKFSIRRSKGANRASCVSTTQSSSRVVVVPQHIKAQIIQQLAAVEESVGLEAALVDPATLERQRQQLLKAAQSTSSKNATASSSLACQTLSQPSQCLARVWAQCHAYDEITCATKQGTTSSATSKCVGLF